MPVEQIHEFVIPAVSQRRFRNADPDQKESQFIFPFCVSRLSITGVPFLGLNPRFRISVSEEVCRTVSREIELGRTKSLLSRLAEPIRRHCVVRLPAKG